MTVDTVTGTITRYGLILGGRGRDAKFEIWATLLV